MGTRQRILALLAAVAAACVAVASPHAALRVGVAEDAAKGYADGGDAFLSQLTGSGLSVLRLTVYWDPTQPTTIQEKASLDRALPVAEARSVTVILSIVPQRATSISSTPNGPDLYAAYCVQVARTYPWVKYLLVGNEPNQPRFWRPQFDASGARVAAANYLQVLSRAYDALKAADPAINVLGLGLSPRGNNRARAVSNGSTAPVTFIRDLGVAYRASARARPIMDYAAFHPYPNPGAAADAPDKGLQWPNAGVPNLDRLQQAFWDAFHGTGQPLFGEGAAGDGVRWIFDESGWQTETRHAVGYFGDENTQTVSEEVQGQFYADVIGRYACDARVAMLLFFHWADEADRDRMQTGLLRADGSAKEAPRTCGTRSSAGAAERRRRGRTPRLSPAHASRGRRRAGSRSRPRRSSRTARASSAWEGAGRPAAPSPAPSRALPRRTGRCGRGCGASSCVRAAMHSPSHCARR